MRKILIFSCLLWLTLAAGAQTNCSDCSVRLLNKYEIEQLSKHELRLLKNEIYARKGYTFSGRDLKEHFAQYAWYKPLNDNKRVVLNQTETKNVKLIDSFMNDEEDNYTSSAEDNGLESSKYLQLSDDEVKYIFTTSKRKELGIKYDIWKVYSYSDRLGSYYLVLSESSYNSDGATVLKDKIQAINLKVEGSRMLKTFEANDFIKQSVQGDEDDIHFWTKYIYTEDFDNDGLTEPILIYGARGYNGYEDGWVKILIYNKNVKTRIWIHNSTLDGERYIDIDRSFYSLPKAIQNKVIAQMERMQENDHCYYPYSWKKDIANQKMKITE